MCDVVQCEGDLGVHWLQVQIMCLSLARPHANCKNNCVYTVCVQIQPEAHD